MRKLVLSVLCVYWAFSSGYAAENGKGRKFTAEQLNRVTRFRYNVEPSLQSKPGNTSGNRDRLGQILKKRVQPKNSTQETITISTMGESVNAFTAVGNGRTNLFANPMLNSVSFVRRGGPSDPAGSDSNPGNRLYFDLNTKGGADGFWQISKGPLYENDPYLPSEHNQGSRYPQGVLWSPPGSTDTNQAVVYTAAPVLNGTNGGWGGLAQGWIKATGTGSLHKQRMAPSSDIKRYISEGMDVAPNGSIFFIDPERELIGETPTYTGNVVLYRMTYNSAANDWDSTITTLPFVAERIGSSSIGFGPDGTTGYIALTAVSSAYGVEGYYAPFVSKSTDGGNTWSEFHLVDVNPENSPEVDSFRVKMLGSWVNFTGDGQIVQVPAGSPYSHKVQYSTSFDLDLTVDKHNAVHIMTGMMIGGFTDTLAADETVRSGLGQWLVDITMSDPRFPYGFILNETKSFRGCYGDCSTADNFTEDNRPQATRNWDGSLLAFCYFDTDTADFEPAVDGSENSNPDFWVRAIRVNGPHSFTLSESARNKTKGSNTAGSMVCGSVSPYMLPSPTQDSTFIIPVSAILTGPAPFSDPVTHLYLDGVSVSARRDSAPEQVPLSSVYHRLFLGNQTHKDAAIGLSFSVAPNPVRSTLSVQVSSEATTKGSLLVTNALGQEIERKSIALQKGENTLSVRTNEFNSGIYFLNITTGDQSISQRFVKE